MISIPVTIQTIRVHAKLYAQEGGAEGEYKSEKLEGIALMLERRTISRQEAIIAANNIIRSKVEIVTTTSE